MGGGGVAVDDGIWRGLEGWLTGVLVDAGPHVAAGVEAGDHVAAGLHVGDGVEVGLGW